MKGEKNHCFQRNGALLLQSRLHYLKGKENPIRFFSEKELVEATNDNDLVRPGCSLLYVYKGHIDGRAVAIKMRTHLFRPEEDVKQLITEITILSSIRHKNVVRLLGCCLETPVPFLVYEHISNGNLCDYITRDGTNRELLSWTDRLRIANEVADGLNYLHSYLSAPIIHKNIKSNNIMLDDHYTAKIIGFSLVLPMPVDKVVVEDPISGTFGYLDPEYFITLELNEKSDVYSYGVVLLQLLTGKKAVNTRGHEPVNLVESFLSCVQDDQVAEILDAIVIEEGSTEQISLLIDVAMKCVSIKRLDRPSMKEVVQELRRIRKMRQITDQAI